MSDKPEEKPHSIMLTNVNLEIELGDVKTIYIEIAKKIDQLELLESHGHKLNPRQAELKQRFIRARDVIKTQLTEELLNWAEEFEAAKKEEIEME